MQLPDKYIRGSKRTNIVASDWMDDWYSGFGKDESCRFEGSWKDMVYFARNVLSSKNTEIVAPEYYHPEW